MSIKTSISELNMFDSCKRKWLYSKVIKRRNESLVFGSAYQKGIEVWAKDENHNREKAIRTAGKWLANQDLEFRKEAQWNFEDYVPKVPNELYHTLFDDFVYKKEYEPQEKEILDKIKELYEILPVMLNRYFDWFEENKFEWLKIEFSMNHIKNNYSFYFKPDGLIKDSDNRIWIIENKSSSKINAAHLPLDQQTGTYLAFYELMTGEKIAGIIWNQNLKMIPNLPKILKDGNLSSDKSQKTTHELYYNEIIRLYGDLEYAPLKILECYNELLVKRDFLEIRYITKSEFQKQNILKYTEDKSKVLSKYKGNFLKNGFEDTFKKCCPNFSMNCNTMCPFYKECLGYETEKEILSPIVIVKKVWNDNHGHKNIKIDFYGTNRYFEINENKIREYHFKDIVTFEKEYELDDTFPKNIKKILNEEMKRGDYD